MKSIQINPGNSTIKESLTSIREALDVLGGKWKVPIMVSLSAGSKRFTEIQSHLVGITSKVLSHELKELESNNLVIRTIDKETEIIQYAVTSKCKSLEKVIEGLKEWGDYHRSNIFQRPITTHPILSYLKHNGETTVET